MRSAYSFATGDCFSGSRSRSGESSSMKGISGERLCRLKALDGLLWRGLSVVGIEMTRSYAPNILRLQNGFGC